MHILKFYPFWYEYSHVKLSFGRLCFEKKLSFVVFLNLVLHCSSHFCSQEILYFPSLYSASPFIYLFQHRHIIICVYLCFLPPSLIISFFRSSCISYTFSPRDHRHLCEEQSGYPRTVAKNCRSHGTGANLEMQPCLHCLLVCVWSVRSPAHLKSFLTGSISNSLRQSHSYPIYFCSSLSLPLSFLLSLSSSHLSLGLALLLSLCLSASISRTLSAISFPTLFFFYLLSLHLFLFLSPLYTSFPPTLPLCLCLFLSSIFFIFLSLTLSLSLPSSVYLSLSLSSSLSLCLSVSLFISSL